MEEGRNGYFQLSIQGESVFLKVFPPQEGGKKVDVKEAIAYLDFTGYNGYDLKELNRAIISEGESQAAVGIYRGFHENERMHLTVSQDNMLAYGRFYPPSEQGQRMTAEEIKTDLAAQNIKVGIQEDNIAKFLSERQYCKDYLVAKGIPPKQGIDGKIEYFFSTNKNLKPKRNEDGTVDYHHLDTISHIEAGQCLAKITKETPGEPGKNILGEEIAARQVKTQRFSFSNKISVSEDGLELISDVTGHASLVNGKVFVADVFAVPADVDNATGDIDYEGNVSVRGNVKSGFTIKAKGDIVVEGVVEGAVLNAGGQIIVKRGIHGMTKGSLTAKGNIITKFIENATVSAGGYVETESILHSQVAAGTDIRVGGKKGFVTGGVVRASNILEAVNIGSEMGGATRIEVGVEPAVKERYALLQKEIPRVNKEQEQIRPILQNFTERMSKQEKIAPDKVKQVQALAKTYKENQAQLVQMQEEFSGLYETMSTSTNAKVKVRGTIYPGVWVGISDIGINIKEQRSYVQIIKEKGEVAIRPL